MTVASTVIILVATVVPTVLMAVTSVFMTILVGVASIIMTVLTPVLMVVTVIIPASVIVSTTVIPATVLLLLVPPLCFPPAQLLMPPLRIPSALFFPKALLLTAIGVRTAPVITRTRIAAIIVTVGHAAAQRHCGPEHPQHNIPTVHMLSHWPCTSYSSSSDLWVSTVNHLKSEPFILDTLLTLPPYSGPGAC